MFFGFDILIWLNTGFYDNGIINLSRRDIGKNYLRKKFWLDLAAVVPYIFVINIIESYYNVRILENYEGL